MKKNLFTLFFILIPLAGFAQQTLPNGIVLPEQWPPVYDVPAKAHEMPLPYIDHKPGVIPINTGRQLFVDQFLIAETNLKRVCHKPNFYFGNPVLEPTETWENTASGMPYASPFSDGLWYDEKDQKFKVWYLAGAGMLYKDDPQGFYTCYAESNDGKHWNKVKLDILPGTNVVDTCRRDASTIWLDRQELRPERRWKMFTVTRRSGDSNWRFVLRYSADGIHWSNGVAQSGDVNDRSTAFYNPFTHKWVLSLRYGTPVSGRSRAYIENADPETLVSLTHRTRPDVADKNIVFWFTPDDKELHHPLYPEVHPGIYNFDAIAYESLMLGEYAAWCGPENNICARDGIQKRNVVSLGFSRDGFHFYRPTHEAFMDVNETEGAWNWGNMQSICGVPLIVGDSLYFYSSGRRKNKIFWDCYSSTGLATLRRDGFASMHADRKEGYLLTEKISFDGRHFFVNADVKGKNSSLKVELLDANGTPIPGFTKDECIALKKVDSTKSRVVWKNNADVSALVGKTLRVKFYLTNSDLYAFWVSPWQSGESRGYTAGGGPGLSPTGIDVPCK